MWQNDMRVLFPCGTHFVYETIGIIRNDGCCCFVYSLHFVRLSSAVGMEVFDFGHRVGNFLAHHFAHLCHFLDGNFGLL